jgi:putative oxidoreductase
MNIVLWILQILLAIAFFAHGLLFLFPPAEIAALMNASLPRWFRLFLGWAEILAAVGLTLPAVTRVQPWLVTWAAIGIVIVMVSATYYHVVRSEISSAVVTLILLVMAAFMAYMRYRVMPIESRARSVHNVRV